MAELIELSDLAWTIVDADGEHESIEQAWTAALPDDWAPGAGLDELRMRLDQVTETVKGNDHAALPGVVAAVIVYLAAHPQRRRPEQALIVEALRDEYGEHLPDEVAAWLARQPSRTAHVRHRGPRTRRRYLHSPPPASTDGG